MKKELVYIILLAIIANKAVAYIANKTVKAYYYVVHADKDLKETIYKLEKDVAYIKKVLGAIKRNGITINENISVLDKGCISRLEKW